MGYSSADGSYRVAFSRFGISKPVESTAHTLDSLLGLKLPKLVVGDTQLLELARTKEVANTGFAESFSIEIDCHSCENVGVPYKDADILQASRSDRRSEAFQDSTSPVGTGPL